MKFKKAVLINISDSHFDQKYWDKIDSLVESRVLLQRDDPKLLDKLKDADLLLLGFQVTIGKDIIDTMPNLKLINILATAYGTVDLEAASDRDIPVCNLASYSTEAVAEFIIAAILFKLRGMAEGLRRAKDGDWNFTGIRARELKDSRFGVIGLGNIGNRVAELASGFGANVSYWSRAKKDIGLKYERNLDDLIANNDIISINVAENDDTISLLNSNNIPLIPKDGVLVSTVPPSVIDTDALALRLAKNDVNFIFVNHPYPSLETELVKIKDFANVTGYPAIGFITDEARIAKQEIFIGNITSYLEGKVQNKVN
jgi:lactate dehydrogenase-like 2-hydroxyacid dehydrogenase